MRDFLLAYGGNLALVKATVVGESDDVLGGVGEMQISSSGAMSATLTSIVGMNKQLPVSMIAGVTSSANFGALGILPYAVAGGLNVYCTFSDPMATMMTPQGLETEFGNDENDGIVSKGSQTNNTYSDYGEAIQGVIHSLSLERLGLRRPAELTSVNVQDAVVVRLNEQIGGLLSTGNATTHFLLLP